MQIIVGINKFNEINFIFKNIVFFFDSRNIAVYSLQREKHFFNNVTFSRRREQRSTAPYIIPSNSHTHTHIYVRIKKSKGWLKMLKIKT